jgi:hypothetical protein
MIEAGMPTVVSYGCTAQTANAVLIIHSFVNGQPDDYLVVPKGWIKEIIQLKEIDYASPINSNATSLSNSPVSSGQTEKEKPQPAQNEQKTTP